MVIEHRFVQFFELINDLVQLVRNQFFQFLPLSFLLNISKEQRIQELEKRNRALEEELQTKIVYFEEEEILAKLLWCEARNQSWEGQVYTCSAILNYCERNNTSIWDAAHNINSFEPAPYVDDAKPTAMQYEVIYYVLNGGRIPDICWFRTGHYHNFGTPVAKVGDHYFSKP